MGGGGLDFLRIWKSPEYIKKKRTLDRIVCYSRELMKLGIRRKCCWLCSSDIGLYIIRQLATVQET